MSLQLPRTARRPTRQGNFTQLHRPDFHDPVHVEKRHIMRERVKAQWPNGPPPLIGLYGEGWPGGDINVRDNCLKVFTAETSNISHAPPGPQKTINSPRRRVL